MKAALDEQLEEYERRHPKAEAALVRQGWLQKCQSNGLVWQGRWFVRRQRPFCLLSRREVLSAGAQTKTRRAGRCLPLRRSRTTRRSSSSSPRPSSSVRRIGLLPSPPAELAPNFGSVSSGGWVGDESAAPKPNPKGEVDLKDIKGIALASAYSECEFGIRLRDRVGRAPYELRAPSAELCQCAPASNFCALALALAPTPALAPAPLELGCWLGWQGVDRGSEGGCGCRARQGGRSRRVSGTPQRRSP